MYACVKQMPTKTDRMPYNKRRVCIINKGDHISICSSTLKTRAFCVIVLQNIQERLHQKG